MKQKILALTVVSILAAGCAMIEPGTLQPSREAKKPPVIVQSFAPKELRPGAVWKIYLKASDPEGQMQYIFATVTQPGHVPYPTSIIRIKGENQKELSGYVYLNSPVGDQTNFLNFTLTLTVSIKGTGGFSQPVVFPLSFEAGPTPELPPDGVFKEQNLGPISVTLQGGAMGAPR